MAQNGLTRRLSALEEIVAECALRERPEPLQDDLDAFARALGQTPAELVAAAEACALRVLEKHWAGLRPDEITAEMADDDPRCADVRGWVIAILEENAR